MHSGDVMKKIRGINDGLSRKQNIIILFPAGFIIGVILGFTLFDTEQISNWIECLLTFVIDVSIIPSSFFCYVLWKRLKQFGMLVLFCFMPYGPLMYYSYLLFCLIIYGIVFSCFCNFYGLGGFFVGLASLMPHFILYGIVLYCGYELFICFWSSLHGSDSRSQFKPRLHVCIKGVYIPLIMLVLVVAIIGLVTECYVNPLLVKFFVNIFLK